MHSEWSLDNHYQSLSCTLLQEASSTKRQADVVECVLSLPLQPFFLGMALDLSCCSVAGVQQAQELSKEEP